MGITNPDDVKILVTQDIDPNDLTLATTLSDKQLVAITGLPISEIDENQPAYGALESIGAIYAAWIILSGWDKEAYFDKAKMMWDNYITAVKNFKEMPIPKELENPAVIITESEYTIPALNPNISHYMSSY